MAGDWVKIEENTPDKPEVQRMASRLGLDPDTVVGKLIRVWVWATRNCNADGVTHVTIKALLNRITCVSGFAESMLEVGWLIENGADLVFPNFDYHNSETAKTRAKTNKRVKKHRGKKVKQKCNAESVTEALPEKRREEKNIKTTLPAREAEEFSGQDPGSQEGSVVIPPCSLSEATHYAATIGMADEVATLWWEKRDAEDWRPRGGELPLTTKSWKIELKQYHFNKTRIENERRRNQKTGSGTAGKASENPRNRHLPPGLDQRNKDQSDMEDIRDYLRRIAERPQYAAEFAGERVYDRPQYLNAVNWLKEHQRGLHAKSFNQLAEHGFIDAESGRWTGPRSE